MDTAALKERINLYERLMRLDKPIGTLLLLWPTMWAIWIAGEGRPRWEVVIIFAVGTLLMRSAGCVMNDMADRKFDPQVERTRDRPLAAGRVSLVEAAGLATFLALASFSLVLYLNLMTIGLSFVALFVAASYPFTKRIIALPQAYLGIAFGFGIPMGFAAQVNVLPLASWLLLAANIFWALAYDTEYAMVDRDDDLKIGIKTSAITFGRHDVLAVMLCYAGMLAILVFIGAMLRFGPAYYAGLWVAAVMMGYHYRWIRTRSREGCFRAFNHNNWVGGVIFAGIVADYWLCTG